MGIFDFFSRKRAAGSAGAVPQPPQDVAAPIDYAPLVPMAALISNDDPQVAADMALLAAGYETFRAAYPGWCETMSFGDVAPEHYDATVRDVFVYWLAGYDTPFQYGAYIDWKAAPEDIVWQLERAAASLHAPLDVAAIPFSGDEDTATSLERIAQHVRARGYALTVIDTESDSYHLYLVPETEYGRIVALGASVGFTVVRPA